MTDTNDIQVGHMIFVYGGQHVTDHYAVITEFTQGRQFVRVTPCDMGGLDAPTGPYTVPVSGINRVDRGPEATPIVTIRAHCQYLDEQIRELKELALLWNKRLGGS